MPLMHPDDLLALIDQHLDTGNYEWARDTLEGIRATVEETNRVTLRQQEAVEHIIIGRVKHDRWVG